MRHPLIAAVLISLSLSLAACNDGEPADETGDTTDTGDTNDTADTDTEAPPEPAALAIPDSQPTSAVEEDVFTLTVQIVDADGAIVSDATNEVTLSDAQGSISGAGDLGGTLTVAAVDGVATFSDLTWDHPESITFDVSAADLAGLDDAPLDVTAKPYTRLVVTQQAPGDDEEAGGFVTSFDKGATGDVAPSTTFYSTAEVWEYPWGIGYDSTTEELLVSLFGGNSVARFPIDADGEQAATSTLTPASTDMEGPSRITVDEYHDEIYIPTEEDSKVYVFARDAVGDASPLRVLGGPASFDGSPVDEVAIDYANDEIFVVGYSSNAIFVFNRTDDGDAAPKRTITGEATTLSGSAAVVLVTEHNELIVADYGGTGAILTFDASATGDVAPVRSIAGDATLLEKPSGLAYDPETDEIFVADESSQIVSVFNRTDSGDTAPKRTLGGDAVVFSRPSDLVLAR